MSNGEYKGYKYSPFDDYEEDNRKRFHYVIAPDGKHLVLPLSPYDYLYPGYLELWVDAGCPYPESQRLTIQELKDIIANQILLGDDREERTS